MKARNLYRHRVLPSRIVRLLKGVQHPDGVGPDVVTTPVQSFDPATGVIETKNTRYTKAAAPSKLYKPTHGGYPEFTGQFSAAKA